MKCRILSIETLHGTKYYPQVKKFLSWQSICVGMNGSVFSDHDPNPLSSQWEFDTKEEAERVLQFYKGTTLC